MDSDVGLFRSWSRVIALTLIAAGAAGCSADTTRFNDGTYRNNQGEVTGSITPGQAAPVGRVDARPLPQQSQAPVQQQYAARPAPPAPAVTGGGSAGGGRGIASYSPAGSTYQQPAPVAYNQPTAVNYAPQPAPEFTGSVVAPSSVVRKPVAQ